MQEQIKTLRLEDQAERPYPPNEYENSQNIGFAEQHARYIHQQMQSVWINDHAEEGWGTPDSLFAQYDDYATAYDWFVQDRLWENSQTMFPLREMDGTITAQAVVGVAISNTSPNQQNAYDFLRLVMTGYDFFDENVFPSMTPISDQLLYNQLLEDAESCENVYPELIGEIVPAVTEMKEWFADVGHATFRSGFYDRLEAYFEPYYNDEATYEECLAKAKRELLLYVSE